MRRPTGRNILEHPMAMRVLLQFPKGGSNSPPSGDTLLRAVVKLQRIRSEHRNRLFDLPWNLSLGTFQQFVHARFESRSEICAVQIRVVESSPRSR